MLEILGTIFGIIGSLFAFLRWVWPWIKRWRADRLVAIYKIKVSFRDKSIELGHENLKDMLWDAKGKIFQDNRIKFKVTDIKIAEWERKSKKLAPKERSEVAEYTSRLVEKEIVFESVLSKLYQKHILEMIQNWAHDGDSLIWVFEGVFDALTTANMSGRTKFDVWKGSDIEDHYAIYVHNEELDEIYKNSFTGDEVGLKLGPGNYFGDELPNKIKLKYLIPQMLLSLMRKDPSMSIESEQKALLLHTYSVGIG